MLSDSDRRWLERAAGARGAATQRVWASATVFMLLAGLVNLGLAAYFGSREGCTLFDLAQRSFAGFQVDRFYSGVYVKGIERLMLGSLQLGAAIVFGIMIATQRIERQRWQAVLRALRDAEVGRD